jgi:membrane peptidoglycan carboxypeptidase
VWQAPEPEGERAVSAATAYLVSDILEGNTIPSQNEIWAEKLEVRNGPRGEHRPAAVKTGTANDAKDLSTYGYLAPPKKDDAPAWAVGVWIGNSDHSTPRSADPATSLTAAAPLWQAYVRRLTKDDPVASFREPKGVVEARIDAWSGGAPGPWTRDTTTELFRAGTQPGARHEVDRAGLLYSAGCGTWMVDPLKAELGPSSWNDDVANWMARARRGVGVVGPHDSRTAYFWGRIGWGGRIAGPCPAPQPTPQPDRDPDPGPPDDKPGKPDPGKPDPGKPEKPPKPEPPGRDPGPEPPEDD